jgi:hypothetical protein
MITNKYNFIDKRNSYTVFYNTTYQQRMSSFNKTTDFKATLYSMQPFQG